MSDTIAERRSVFQGTQVPAKVFDAAARQTFAMREVAPAARWSLRGDAATLAAAGQPAGFDLTQPINTLRSTAGGDRLSLRIGPDEWLLIADDGAAASDIRVQLDTELSPTAHTLVDVSHRNIALELTGADAVDVINTGCPLNLSDTAFPVGMATRTLFAKAEIVLVRRADAEGLPLYRIEVWRSFGRYLFAHLTDSAALLGVGR